MAWSREAGAGCLGLSQKRPTGDTGMREKEGLFFPKNQALVVGWHIHLGERLGWRSCPGWPPRPPALPPTILSRSRPLAQPRSSKKAVSRSPHSGFLQEGKRQS